MTKGFSIIAALLVAQISFGQQPPMTLRFGIRNDVTTPNPFVNTAAQDHDLRTLIYEPLLLQDKSYQVGSYLADSWEISRNGLVYTFSLRPDVTFHNGKALLADDVRWSIKHGQDRIYREFVELIHREVPVLYYLISPSVFVYRPELKGFEVRDQGQFFAGDMGIPFSWIER